MSELIDGGIVEITPEEQRRLHDAMFSISPRFQDNFYAGKSTAVEEHPIPGFDDILEERGLIEKQTRMLTPEEVFDFLRDRREEKMYLINNMYSNRGVNQCP
ncbi:MAG: hypothetical protein CMH61_02720 [Nanoarchaeota archaeon]|nr:hypothetical protein [Nanoarchaeota archaeon]|tara:strand:- start:2305 stop:2610 length:306 start_codon:yes stop_codon:yes gene_type:complete